MIFGTYRLLKSIILTICLVVLISIPKTVLSQSLNTDTIANYKVRTWFGYSYQSVVFLGKTANTTTQFYSLGISKLLKSYSPNSNLYYTIDVIPFLKYNYPQRDRNELKADIIGFGISPFGVHLEHQLTNRFSFISGSSGGFALVERNFPTDKGRKLNFMFDLSTSILTKVADHLSFALGYKFHHISNANTGSQNPGIDSNFLYFSIHIN